MVAMRAVKILSPRKLTPSQQEGETVQVGVQKVKRRHSQSEVRIRKRVNTAWITSRRTILHRRQPTRLLCERKRISVASRAVVRS